MGVVTGCGFKEIYRFPHTTVDREIFVVKKILLLPQTTKI